MTENERRNELRAMSAEDHWAYFQANGQPLRDALQAGMGTKLAFKQCTQEAVNDFKALLHWQEFAADNIPSMATDVRDYDWFLYEAFEEARGEPVWNHITIVGKETGCYSRTKVEEVDYNAGFHKATPTLAAMQNLVKEPCGNTRIKLPT